MTSAAPLTLTVQDVRHSAESARWYTPSPIIEAARDLMGGIDLDPASDEAANANVRATRIFAEADDGLRQPWSGRIWLNPPTPPKEWWLKLSRLWVADQGTRAVYLAYSIEQVQQSQLWAEAAGAPHMLHYSVCFPKRRIPFLRTVKDAIAAIDAAVIKRGPNAKLARERAQLAELPPLMLTDGDSPAHASALVGVGMEASEFRARFGWLGWCS